ncbi:hypothetical protein MA16_Dca028810 [Dendrobium catenatum]|uniref:Uncharacterized protein n=1 Tax=Dendrobium catenatum TaxID=906689 RepID=A0A2I0V797_9ASPA|nr:hypothetical protein MA16_Dca028810 [Dendrobium catenatum]
MRRTFIYHFHHEQMYAHINRSNSNQYIILSKLQKTPQSLALREQLKGLVDLREGHLMRYEPI